MLELNADLFLKARSAAAPVKNFAAVGVRMSSITSMVVVLPAPLGPEQPKEVPGRIAKLTPSTAVKEP